MSYIVFDLKNSNLDEKQRKSRYFNFNRNKKKLRKHILSKITFYTIIEVQNKKALYFDFNYHLLKRDELGGRPSSSPFVAIEEMSFVDIEHYNREFIEKTIRKELAIRFKYDLSSDVYKTITFVPEKLWTALNLL